MQDNNTVSREDTETRAETERARPMTASARLAVAAEQRQSNVAALKTKAEQALAQTFETIADRLPGSAGVRELREEAIKRFEALGLPHRRIESWKYSDLRNVMKAALPPAQGAERAIASSELEAALGPLAAVDAMRIVFVDGAFVETLSDLKGSEAVAVVPLGRSLEDDPGAADVLRLNAGSDDAMLALNTAYVADGAVVGIAKQAKLDRPLMIVSVRASAEPQCVFTRNAISVGEGAEATIIEAFVALPGAAAESQLSAVTELGVGDNAHLSHVRCAIDNGQAMQLGNWVVGIGAGANYRAFQFTAEVGFVRNQLDLTFEGPDAKIDLSGAYLARASQHVDSTLVVDHAVPGCVSRELYKGVLGGEARGVFQGKVIVRPDAQKTDGKQMAQVMMLSPNAEFDSKPELEIFADDVVCGHGSTSAAIDEDLLFYCRSRGIPEAEARVLLIESFIGEALDKVEHEGVRQSLTELARSWLAQAAAEV